MLSTKRLLIPLLSALLLLIPLAGLACGDDDDEEVSADPNGGEQSDLATASDSIDQMISAAEAGDVDGAKAAFDSAHDPLHEVIEMLEESDPTLADELDEALEHAEEAFEEGEGADHVVDEAGEISDLLDEAAAVLEG